ncbi:MAG: tRNA (cytidine(34)-2'-O)-methyltransferase [Leptospirales bacterium]
MEDSPVIALYRPQIPPNTGNIGRLCVAIQSPLYIVGRSPILLDQKSVRRAGLDYWQFVDVHKVERFKHFYEQMESRRIVAFTKSSGENSGKNRCVNVWDFTFKKGDVLLFGNETAGLPPRLLKLVKNHVYIPMWGQEIRSLNLANSVSIAAYEYLRQIVPAQLRDGIDVERTYYKKPTYNERT